jgi:hypothetical protein
LDRAPHAEGYMARRHRWSLYRRPESTALWVRFYVAGKLVRRTTDTADQGEAETRAGAIWVEERKRHGAPVAAEERQTLARRRTDDAAAEWTAHLERIQGEHREQFVRRYEADLNLYIVPRWAFVDEITSASWEQTKRALHRTGGGPLGWRSIQHLTTTVRKLLRHECELGWLESVPELRPPPNRLVRQEQAPRRAYSRPERERFLGAIRAPFPRSHRFYTVLFFSLLRRGELWALTPRWIDSAGERIRIPATDSKSGEAEEIDMHPRAAKALRAELRSRRGIALDEPLFGKHDAREAFRHGLAKGKIDPHGLVPHHSTRHTGATMAGEATTDVLELLAAGRWRSLAMAQRYVHADARRAKRVIRRL